MAAASGPPSATTGSNASPLTVTERGALQGAAAAPGTRTARASTASATARGVMIGCNACGDPRVALLQCASDGSTPRRPPAVLPCPRAGGPRALARARRLPRVGAPAPRGRAVGVLGGPADRQRPPGLAPRPRARLQGHL